MIPSFQPTPKTNIGGHGQVCFCGGCKSTSHPAERKQFSRDILTTLNLGGRARYEALLDTYGEDRLDPLLTAVAKSKIGLQRRGIMTDHAFDGLKTLKQQLANLDEIRLRRLSRMAAFGVERGLISPAQARKIIPIAMASPEIEMTRDVAQLAQNTAQRALNDARRFVASA